jgi:hypothetical protein
MNVESTCKRLLSILDTDPVKEMYEGKQVGKEYLYTLRLLEWITKLEPATGDELKVATCGHHIYRWRIPREKYPMDRQGYNEWRMKLMFLHAGETAKILEEEGYSSPFINRVKSIILKRNPGNDPEVQTFEDAINLTFLEYYMVAFSRKHEHSKLVDISRKILKKMSPRAIELAMNLNMPDSQREIIKLASGTF